MNCYELPPVTMLRDVAQPHRRDEPPQLVHHTLGHAGLSVLVGQEHPCAEREIADGDERSPRLPGHVRAAVDRGQLCEGGPAPAQLAAHVVAARHLHVTVRQAHEPPCPSTVRPSQQVHQVREIGRPRDRPLGEPLAHQRAERES